MPTRRLAPRRRRNDEDDDENSLVGELEDDSMSDGSASSIEGDLDDDGETSQIGEEKEMDSIKTSAPGRVVDGFPTTTIENNNTSQDTRNASEQATGLNPSTDSRKDSQPAEAPEHLSESDSKDASLAEPSQAKPHGPTAFKREESFAQKSRREHQDYIRQRDANPAFVPNRGGFFLHDDRSSAAPPFRGRPYGRGSGRGFNGVVPTGRGVPFPDSIEKQWSHDLHEGHESSKAPPLPAHEPVPLGMPHDLRSGANSSSSAPNREFSFENVLGKVTVCVALPGMEAKNTIPGLTKKQHVLLPTHRPPLRRDKPVRISIPDVEPSYRFPSTERSFIFIPRALRPNQQSYMRGRGRGSFHGSRRPSIFNGSVYTPSVGMSRRSSLGGVRDSRSPAGSAYGRPSITGMEPPRPVVRMPMTGPAPIPMGGIPFLPMAQANGSVSHGVHSTAIPMHQPRPQKAVSLTNIESPASLAIKAPQQQHEQPFHQQVLPYVAQAPSDDGRGQAVGHASASGGTPLSHIPEGAIFAQPFQPHPMATAPVYYPGPYGQAAVYYPTMQEAAQGFGGGWMDNNYQSMATGQGHLPHQGIPIAHEQNGMVYYPDGSVSQAPHAQYPMAGQPNMMPMTGGYGYYPMMPNPMFYQQP